MPLQFKNIAVGNLQDDVSGNNYAANKAVYILNLNNTLAQIFSDESGTTAIVQDGVNNVTGARGVFGFWVEAGDYFVQVGANKYRVSITGADYFNNRVDETIDIIVNSVAGRGAYYPVGSFEAGFTYTDINQVGTFGGADYYIYTGGLTNLPHNVTAGTDPTLSSDYAKVAFNTMSNINYDDGFNAEGAVRGKSGVKIETVAFCLRNYGTQLAPDWQFIIDSAHQCDLNGSTITINASNELVVNFNKTYNKIISFVCGPDETFTKLGFNFGASVGKSNVAISGSAPLTFTLNTGTGSVVDIPTYFENSVSSTLNADGSISIINPIITYDKPQVCNSDNDSWAASYTIEKTASNQAVIKPYRNLAGYITYNGTSFAVDQSTVDGVSVSYSAGDITVTHPVGSASSPVFIQPRYNTSNIRAYSDSYGNSSFVVKYVDTNGSKITTPTTDMKFSFFKSESHFTGQVNPGVVNVNLGQCRVDFNELLVAGANIWCIGVFEV